MVVTLKNGLIMDNIIIDDIRQQINKEWDKMYIEGQKRLKELKKSNNKIKCNCGRYWDVKYIKNKNQWLCPYCASEDYFGKNEVITSVPTASINLVVAANAPDPSWEEGIYTTPVTSGYLYTDMIANTVAIDYSDEPVMSNKQLEAQIIHLKRRVEELEAKIDDALKPIILPQRTTYTTHGA